MELQFSQALYSEEAQNELIYEFAAQKNAWSIILLEVRLIIWSYIVCYILSFAAFSKYLIAQHCSYILLRSPIIAVLIFLPLNLRVEWECSYVDDFLSLFFSTEFVTI